tara:strand:+ start:75222 stop:77423 length:2202 start_codon:yes stop_codon:yes gene_type:complete
MAFLATIDKQETGDIFLNSDFSEPMVLSSIGQEQIVTINNISDLRILNTLTTNYTGENNTRKLKMWYRISTSDNPTTWSEWIEIEPNGETECFTEVAAFYDYNIQIKFVRTGSNTDGELVITDFVWEGLWYFNTITEPFVDLTPDISPIILDVQDVFKVFNIEGYELVVRDAADLEIEYRISQDNKRSWSEWTILTTDNITTHKIDPIRFFNIQYKFEHTGTTGTIKIRDLNLYGEFINISENYLKTNLFGIRENCQNGLIGDSGLNAASGTNNLSMSNGLLSSSVTWDTMECVEADLFNPYDLDGALDLYEKLADDVTKLAGWAVEYYRTEPDAKGIDHSIHEYSLHGVVDVQVTKVMVPDNQFPSNQIAFNQFDLALLDSFEIQVTKKQFKELFGVQYRPNKEDFLYFCDISRMYRVEHAQAIRDFANASVYYKLILGKYNKRADVRATTSTIQDKINSIVDNSTLEELFGTDKRAHKDEVANKEQFETLSNTHERIRSDIKASVDRELLDNAELVLSKYHYNLTGVADGADAVVYQKSDLYLRGGDNRSFIAWFKFSDYSDSDDYNLLSNFSTDLEKGYKFDIIGGELVTNINGTDYTMNISQHLDDEVWYCVLINIDQRQRKVNNYLYKRNVDREIDAKSLKSTKLRLLTSNELTYLPNEYELDTGDLTMKITGSLMKITNLRIFDDVIPEDQHTKILNQQIIRDSDHAIMADNANRIYVLPSYPYHGS